LGLEASQPSSLNEFAFRVFSGGKLGNPSVENCWSKARLPNPEVAGRGIYNVAHQLQPLGREILRIAWPIMSTFFARRLPDGGVIKSVSPNSPRNSAGFLHDPEGR
jgi:hypothetical protein